MTISFSDKKNSAHEEFFLIFYNFLHTFSHRNINYRILITVISQYNNIIYRLSYLYMQFFTLAGFLGSLFKSMF